MRETGTGRQVAELHGRYMMMMMTLMILQLCKSQKLQYLSSQAFSI